MRAFDKSLFVYERTSKRSVLNGAVSCFMARSRVRRVSFSKRANERTNGIPYPQIKVFEKG